MFFEQTIQKILSEKNVKIEISGKDHFDIFEEMLNNEIPQNYIIEKFEQEMNIPFENIMECEPNYEIISKVSMSKIEELCIFPFKKEGILYIDPMDYSLPGSSIHGIFQARVLELGAIAFSVICSLESPFKFSFAFATLLFGIRHLAFSLSWLTAFFLSKLE